MEMAYLVQKQRAFFQKGVTKSLTFRKNLWKGLRREFIPMKRRFIRRFWLTLENQNLSLI